MNKSSSKQATTTTNNQRQIQLSTGGDNEGVIATAGGDLTMLDGGAIEESYSFSSSALEIVEGVVISALDLVGKDRSAQYEQQTDALMELSERSKTETRQSLSEFTKYFFGTVGVIGLAAALAYGTKK